MKSAGPALPPESTHALLTGVQRETQALSSDPLLGFTPQALTALAPGVLKLRLLGAPPLCGSAARKKPLHARLPPYQPCKPQHTSFLSGPDAVDC